MRWTAPTTGIVLGVLEFTVSYPDRLGSSLQSEKIKQNQPRGLPVSQISNQRLLGDRIRLNDPLPIVTQGSEEVSLVPD